MTEMEKGMMKTLVSEEELSADNIIPPALDKRVADAVAAAVMISEDSSAAETEYSFESLSFSSRISLAAVFAPMPGALEIAF